MGFRPRILFLYSDTGGGHRSAANAIIEALETEFPGTFDIEMVDFFTQYYPAPLSRAKNIYPALVKFPSIWGMSYSLSDGRIRSKLVSALAYPMVCRATRKLLADTKSDLIVSVHPLVNTVVLKAMHHSPVPFITVVTDLVSTHSFWFDRKADLLIVPTEKAAEVAQKEKIPKGNIRVTGLPVAQKFLQPYGAKTDLRKKLGWLDKPTVLLMAGGDGLGPIIKIVNSLNIAKLPCQLIVVCGRNKNLKDRITRIDWQIDAKIYGFTDDIAEFMAASDILLTKAGPSTISEGLVMGLPMILYSRLPGQEEGNVEYLENTGSGIWASDASEVVIAVRQWLENPLALTTASQAAKAAARPNAARNIARILADHIGVSATDLTDLE